MLARTSPPCKEQPERAVFLCIDFQTNRGGVDDPQL